MSNNNRNNSKTKFLSEHKTLNPLPERVEDELFENNEFFDSNDIMQLKYEMLRRVQIDGWNVQQAAKAFGFSRPSFYKIQKAFQKRGLIGLLPQKSGPKEAHKLSEEVMNFIEQTMQANQSLRAPGLVVLVQERFGTKVHPRSIERALFSRRKKKAIVSK